MDPKLTILFCLIGTIIGLSHLSHERLTKMKSKFDGQYRWDIVPRRRSRRSPGGEACDLKHPMRCPR